MLMLGENIIPISLETSWICCFSSAVNPVVPMTIFLPAFRQISRYFIVASGRVKSIRTSKSSTTASKSSPTIIFWVPAPAKSPASLPLAVLEMATVNRFSSTAAFIKHTPIFPDAPTMAILVIFYPVNLSKKFLTPCVHECSCGLCWIPPPVSEFENCSTKSFCSLVNLTGVSI